MRTKLQTLPWLALLIPLDVIVALALLMTEVVALLARGITTTPALRASPPFQGGEFPSSERRGGCAEGADGVVIHPTATIVVVNWDGKHLLEECLPALQDAIRHNGGNHEILVVDNGSTDGSVEFMRRCFPHIRVLVLDRNYGFGEGNNRGVLEARNPIVVLLNNDMIVHRDFLKPLLDGVQDPYVFAATSQIFFSDTSRRREETGKTRARFDRGFFYFWHDDIVANDEEQQAIPVFWAGGGSCAFDREKYLQIGGFDKLYRPFYVEDADLSYQAWRRGWKCVLVPASRVVHKHRGTSRPKFGNRFIDNTIRKNQYLFVWKNVTDFSMTWTHLINLPRIHASAMRQDGPAFEIRAYLRAVRQLAEAILKRVSSIKHYVLTDHEVLMRCQRS